MRTRNPREKMLTRMKLRTRTKETRKRFATHMHEYKLTGLLKAATKRYRVILFYSLCVLTVDITRPLGNTSIEGTTNIW